MASGNYERPITVNDREQLIYLLTEAAEIEHGLMCSYLYASWSLKQSTDEGLSDRQLNAVSRWRSAIHGVAMEEMLHLALVSNLLISIGSPPHFMRQNFPIAPGYHPSSIVARLTPFTRDTAQHFVYLERPEGIDIAQAAGFESEVDYDRERMPGRLTPTAQDYSTVGHLYRGIEDGFSTLSEKLGENVLFLGTPDAQVGSDVLSLNGLIPVCDLASATVAISTIIEQGEGGRQDAETSHYVRFRSICDEYDAFLRDDPEFQPYRPVVSDPVMFRPITNEGQTHVSARPAAKILDLANAAYGLMLRLLASGFGLPGNSWIRRAEIESAISVMAGMKSLSVLLTTVPANDSGKLAGMNFHLPRSTLALPQRVAGAVTLARRALEIADALDSLAQEVPQIDENIKRRFREIAAQLGDVHR